MNGLLAFIEKKIKMANSKKTHFPAQPILNTFFMKFSWIGPWRSGID